MADRPHQPFEYDPETKPPVWLPDQPKTWDDYVCPACGGIERVSSAVDRPLMHRHRYGGNPLQSGVVLLKKIEQDPK